MDFSSVRLIAVDMDGTLLNAKHELSNDFFPLFEKLKAKGIRFAAASGRQYYNLFNRFANIEQDVIFIAENGSYVVYRGEDILVQAMDENMVIEQLKVVRNVPNAFAILCGKRSAYIENTNPVFLENVRMYYDEFKVVDDLLAVKDDVFLKIAVYDLENSATNTYPYFKHFENDLQVKISGVHWLDLFDKKANKGTALAMVQEKFGIKPEETMAFGDYMNDVEMLQQSYFSYAMENALDEVKAIARFKAKSNNDNGVLLVLQEVADAIS